MKKSLILCFLITQVFAFAGIGVYGNNDIFSSTPPHSTYTDSNTMQDITVTPESFDNAIGGGVFLYLDILPIVDLEANLELAGNTYKFVTNLSPAPGEFPWGRVSGYFTIRKKNGC